MEKGSREKYQYETNKRYLLNFHESFDTILSVSIRKMQLCLCILLSRKNII